MSDENQNMGGTSGAPPATTPTADANGGAASASVPAQPSHRDWNEMARNQRELAKTLGEVVSALRGIAVPPPAQEKSAPAKQETAPAAQSGADALAEVQKLRRELDIERALATHAISDPEYRELITAAVQAKNPTDVGEFIGKYASKFKPATPTTAQATPAAEVKPATPAVTAGTAGTGVGGAPARVQQPGDILAIDGAAWQAMSPAEKKAAYEKQVRKSSGNFNPFAEGRAKK